MLHLTIILNNAWDANTDAEIRALATIGTGYPTLKKLREKTGYIDPAKLENYRQVLMNLGASPDEPDINTKIIDVFTSPEGRVFVNLVAYARHEGFNLYGEIV